MIDWLKDHDVEIVFVMVVALILGVFVFILVNGVSSCRIEIAVKTVTVNAHICIK